MILVWYCHAIFVVFSWLLLFFSWSHENIIFSYRLVNISFYSLCYTGLTFTQRIRVLFFHSSTARVTCDLTQYSDLHGGKLSRGMQRSLPQKVPPNLCWKIAGRLRHALWNLSLKYCRQISKICSENLIEKLIEKLSTARSAFLVLALTAI
jgi:hypothetical protein